MYREAKDTPTTAISDYIIKHNVQIRSINQVSNDEAKYCSFKVEIRVTDMSKILDPEFWPVGVCVRRFYKPRNTMSESNI